MRISRRHMMVSPLCQTFQMLARNTWIDQRDAHASNLGLGEESITDYNLLHLKRSHPTEVFIRKYKRHEEADTGADWIWWFGAHDGWFGMRVQAKRLDFSSLTYDGIKKTVKKWNKLQIDILIDQAKADHLVPIYCFYNSWDSSQYQPQWNCKTFPTQVEDLGCTVANAHNVKAVLKSKTKLAVIDPISWPWMCLVCCTGHSKGSGTLPHRAHDFVVGELARGEQEIPSVREKQPRIVSGIIESQEPVNSDIEREDSSLAGILVIRESERREQP